jgi:hypothetical protein
MVMIMKTDASNRFHGGWVKSLIATFAVVLGLLPMPAGAEEDTNSTTARIIFQGTFPQTKTETAEPPLVYSARVESLVKIAPDRVTQSDVVTVKRLQGKMRELRFALAGGLTVTSVKSTGIIEWGVRSDAKGGRFLSILPEEKRLEQDEWVVQIDASREFNKTDHTVSPMSLSPVGSALYEGTVKVVTDKLLETALDEAKGLLPLKTERNGEFWFRVAAPWSMKLGVKEADPDRRIVQFKDFDLVGTIEEGAVSFVLKGVAHVRHPEGGVLRMLAGPVGVTGMKPGPNMRLEYEGQVYRLRFATNGIYPVEIRFDAGVETGPSRNRVSFEPVAAPLRPVTLIGIAKGTILSVGGSAGLVKRGEDGANRSFFMPSSGAVDFNWYEAKPVVEARLFYSVMGLGEITVSPGLIRQRTLLDYKVMQGRLRNLSLELDGEGEVTGVRGSYVVGWRVLQGEGGRRLEVTLNQEQSGAYELTVYTQSPLGAFPRSVKPLRVVPEGAIRYGGHIRLENQGAVRLEVVEASGLAQISPTRLPEHKAMLRPPVSASTQTFAFRFSGSKFDLEVLADNILPELTVSELLVYHLGETETRIEAEVEIDIREAPLRELSMEMPAGYGVAQLNVPNLSDYVIEPDAGGGPSILRVQLSQPLIGRQVVGFQFTRNHDAPPRQWKLPPVRPLNVKSLRGSIGVTADPGLRLTEAVSDGMGEIATAFFPKKIAELQLAWRLRDETWSATVESERLELSVQADALHLFSVAEGIAYGSTLLNYQISGAPVSTLRVIAPSNYSNVEFVGKEIRNWTATTNGYEVQLHTPVSGTYSMVAGYDMRFNAVGDTLPFDGLRAAGAQSEQGYVIVVSAHQFRTEPATVSPGLVPLETGEVPVEYRLLFDAPILAAYQYAARPFAARLKLTAIGQGETLNQVVDRAVFQTRISSEGNAVTDIRYLVKSKGHSRLRVTVPEGATLWSVKVRNREVVPVKDGVETLIPLPRDVPPNTVLEVDLKVAAKAKNSRDVAVSLPALNTPVLQADWRVSPDPARRLEFVDGTLTPRDGDRDVSGYAWLSQRCGCHEAEAAAVLFALLIGSLVWHWATDERLYRFGLRNGFGGLIGAAALLFAIAALGWFAMTANANPLSRPAEVAFNVPVQAAGAVLSVTVENLPADARSNGVLSMWPVLAGLLLWGYLILKQKGLTRRAGVALGWALVFHGCLRMDNSAPPFFVAVIFFTVVHLVIPLVVRQSGLSRRPQAPASDQDGGDSGGAPSAMTALIIGGLLLGATSVQADKRVVVPPAPPAPVELQRVEQKVRMFGFRVLVDATMNWSAKAGDDLDFLRDPAVLKQIDFDVKGLRLSQARKGNQGVFRLTALKDGDFEFTMNYETQLGTQSLPWILSLPTVPGLVNRVELALDRGDLELEPMDAVSIRPVSSDARSAVYQIVFPPKADARVAWRPKSRDMRAEKPVFFTELKQLFIPAAGIIEGIHEVGVKLAQGQLAELVLSTPEGMTITDVTTEGLKAWRFDPDARRLMAEFDPPLTKPVNLTVASQYTAGTLPYERTLGLLRTEGTAGEIGLAGVATGGEIVLSRSEATDLTAINIEDFPAALVAAEGKRVEGLTLRRAYRYAEGKGGLSIAAAAVKPDVRVQASQTLSLGDDRTVLAANLAVNITRAGVFKLSFELPDNMDMESPGGAALSHWTESAKDGKRIITLHLKGKTEGHQVFNLTLVGPGPSRTNTWTVPRISIREAGKQEGQLIVVPEQGMRLRVAEREGLTQLDPKKSGIAQRGVLAFRLLHAAWKLGMDVERVDPWIQVTTLQDTTVGEGQFKFSAWLDYKIENAGVKSLFVETPPGADGVRFSGELVADSIRGAANTNLWEIKLQRRIIGAHKLLVEWQSAARNEAALTVVGALQPRRVDLRRGFLTLRTSGRLQIGIPEVPAALQPGDWQTIPTSLRESAGDEANHTFRVVESAFALPIRVVRHDVAQLLPARVVSTELSSVVSESGVMLTTVNMMLHPGDKRTLRFTLPEGARFWSGSVNQASVRPWIEEGQILLPLERATEPNAAVPVEFIYSTTLSGGKGRLGLRGPKFDLPLENIAWHVHLPPTWRLKDWDTALQLRDENGTFVPMLLDLEAYVVEQSTEQAARTQEAESQLEIGNRFLVEGQQDRARLAFKNAYTLSQHDSAFNEDARVQLQKLKMQQAVVGLNFRRHVNRAQNEAEPVAQQAAALQILSGGKSARYTQQQVREALGENKDDENALLMKLAENLVEQQEAAQALPETIRAAVPRQGMLYTFTRSLQVEKWADLNIDLRTRVDGESGRKSRAGLFALFFTGTLVLMFAAKRRPSF